MILAAILATTLTACGTPKVGLARTTIDPMPGVRPLTSVKRTTVVTATSTNITTVEKIESPESAQARLRMKELEGNRDVAVARGNQSPGYYPATYGYYPQQPAFGVGGGVIVSSGRVVIGGQYQPRRPYDGYNCDPNPTRAVGAW